MSEEWYDNNAPVIDTHPNGYQPGFSNIVWLDTMTADLASLQAGFKAVTGRQIKDGDIVAFRNGTNTYVGAYVAATPAFDTEYWISTNLVINS